MKVILGGGLVALLARDILGSEWKIIPYGKSEYYTFNPPLCDNYVIKDSIIDEYMDKYALIPVYIRNAFSIAGQLTQNPNLGIKDWLYKIYGIQMPTQADPYWRTHLDYFGYGDCLEIYRRLQQQYITEILEGQETLGKVVHKLTDHIITTDKRQFQYDKIISTIPLGVLTKAMGLGYEFPAKDMWCYHIKTEDLDFEGATHLLVADPEIEFYKATQVNKTTFIFYAAQQIVQPGRYFMAWLKKFDLIGEIHLRNAIPCGPIPDLPEVAAADITLMGSRAVWDNNIDIGTCIKRLLKKS